MFAYQLVALSGSAAYEATSVRGTSISIAVMTSTLMSFLDSDPVTHVCRRRQRPHPHGCAWRAVRSQVGARHACKFSHSRFDCQFLNTSITDHESAAVGRLD